MNQMVVFVLSLGLGLLAGVALAACARKCRRPLSGPTTRNKA